MKQRLKNWFERNAHKESTRWWANFIYFIEALVFPIPPDPFLAVYIFFNQSKWKRAVFEVTFYSVLGGVAGYFIGFWFFDTFGDSLIDLYNLRDEFAAIGEVFKENTFWSIFLAAFTPVPYKAFVIGAGLFSVNFLVFLVAIIFGRGLRFLIVGAISHYFGEKYSAQILKYFDLIGFIVVLLVILYVIWEFL